MHALTCPRPIFQHILQALAAVPEQPAFARVGLSTAGPDREWLVRDRVPSPSTTAGPFVRFALASTPPAGLEVPERWPPGLVGQVYVGYGPSRGHLWGFARSERSIELLQRFNLVGPGTHRIRMADCGWRISDEKLEISDAERERCSRTIGALGSEATWQRLVSLRVAVIGCGRTGSLAAVTLARLGVSRLILIDPDLVERHNLREMDAVTEADVERPKAKALADHLRPLLLAGQDPVIPLVASIADQVALAAAKGCHVLVCCVDNGAARLAAAIVATLYHRVLLDIGTGIHFTANDSLAQGPHNQLRTRVMGADVRLILPGDGCLLCRGSLTDYAQAVDELCHHRSLTVLREGEWHMQRAGSLRSLNQLAVGLGMQMLQDLVAERLQASIWAHLEFDLAGRLQVTYPQPSGEVASCPLCARAGLGDDGLAWS
ncbi:MAG: ThiF family adenylyltransferase [Anaerolineae bacterium]|nr:ThiF family adenylyltransferase [Anaerolineae bacterium]